MSSETKDPNERLSKLAATFRDLEAYVHAGQDPDHPLRNRRDRLGGGADPPEQPRDRDRGRDRLRARRRPGRTSGTPQESAIRSAFPFRSSRSRCEGCLCGCRGALHRVFAHRDLSADYVDGFGGKERDFELRGAGVSLDALPGDIAEARPAGEGDRGPCPGHRREPRLRDGHSAFDAGDGVAAGEDDPRDDGSWTCRRGGYSFSARRGWDSVCSGFSKRPAPAQSGTLGCGNR